MFFLLYGYGSLKQRILCIFDWFRSYSKIASKGGVGGLKIFSDYRKKKNPHRMGKYLFIYWLFMNNDNRQQEDIHMKQLDDDVSPHAYMWNFFSDLDRSDLWPWPNPSDTWDMSFSKLRGQTVQLWELEKMVWRNRQMDAIKCIISLHHYATQSIIMPASGWSNTSLAVNCHWPLIVSLKLWGTRGVLEGHYSLKSRPQGSHYSVGHYCWPELALGQPRIWIRQCVLCVCLDRNRTL